jgi:hypothetical protein
MGHEVVLLSQGTSQPATQPASQPTACLVKILKVEYLSKN